MQRVLDVLDVDYEEVIVPAKREERTDLESITGQRGVPVLVNDNLPEATYTIAPRSRRTSRNTTTDDTHSGDHESDGTQRERWPQSLYGDFFADDSDHIGAERLTHKTGESFGYGSVCIREQERQYEHAS